MANRRMMSGADFMERMNNGLIRTNKFEVEIETPAELNLNPYTEENMVLYCKSINESPSQIGILDNVFRGGRQVKFAGDRVFENMQATFYGDEESRDYFIRWSNMIDNFRNGFTNEAISRPSRYMGILRIVNFDPYGNEYRGLKRFYPNIFPVNVSGLQLDHQQTNQVDIFTVEFAINYTIYENNLTTGVGANISVENATRDFDERRT